MVSFFEECISFSKSQLNFQKSRFFEYYSPLTQILAVAHVRPLTTSEKKHQSLLRIVCGNTFFLLPWFMRSFFIIELVNKVWIWISSILRSHGYSKSPPSDPSAALALWMRRPTRSQSDPLNSRCRTRINLLSPVKPTVKIWTYPLVIKHGNRNWTIHRWFSYWNLHL